MRRLVPALAILAMLEWATLLIWRFAYAEESETPRILRTPAPCAAYLFAVRGDTTMYEVHCVKPQVFRQEMH